MCKRPHLSLEKARYRVKMSLLTRHPANLIKLTLSYMSSIHNVLRCQRMLCTAFLLISLTFGENWDMAYKVDRIFLYKITPTSGKFVIAMISLCSTPDIIIIFGANTLLWKLSSKFVVVKVHRNTCSGTYTRNKYIIQTDTEHHTLGLLHYVCRYNLDIDEIRGEWN
jgi:hypothetical protein